jgi:glycosyltransferase involved in cell wall biosynthesis
MSAPEMDSTAQAAFARPCMRILQVCSAEQLGGGEVHVMQLVEELRRHGHHVEVAGRQRGPIELDHHLPFRNSADISSALGMRRIIRAGGFDIVHAHVARDYPVAACALVGLSAPKLVLTRQLIHRVKWNPLYRRVDAWIATTSQIEHALRHLSPSRIDVIPNWMDRRTLEYKERPLRQPVVIGLLGQISPHKGHDDAIEMIDRLGSGFKLLIGGIGRDDYVAMLKGRAHALPVEFTGFVPAARFLEGIDILILPSWEEPFGIVVLEAMAAGINVIATNAGGPPEILDFGSAGMLVRPRDASALESAVRTLVSDRTLAAQLRERARVRAVTRYDISRVVPRIEKLYRDLREPD